MYLDYMGNWELKWLFSLLIVSMFMCCYYRCCCSCCLDCFCRSFVVVIFVEKTSLLLLKVVIFCYIIFGGFFVVSNGHLFRPLFLGHDSVPHDTGCLKSRSLKDCVQCQTFTVTETIRHSSDTWPGNLDEVRITIRVPSWH